MKIIRILVFLITATATTFANPGLNDPQLKPIHQEGYRDWKFIGGATERLQMVLAQDGKVTFLTVNNTQKSAFIKDLTDEDRKLVKTFQQALDQIKNPLPLKGTVNGNDITTSQIEENIIQPLLDARVMERDGIADGAAQYYFHNKIYFSEFYRNGDIEGAKVFYFPSGKINGIIYFADGRVDGKQLTFYESGVIQYIYFHENGEKIGRAGYHTTGQVTEVTPMVNGEYHGESISYLRDGSSYGRTLWINGKVARETVIKEINARQFANIAATNPKPLKTLWLNSVKKKYAAIGKAKTDGKSGTANDTKERNWTSATGKVIRGVLVSADDQSARFKVRGRLFVLPLAKLSKSDQELIRKLTAK